MIKSRASKHLALVASAAFFAGTAYAGSGAFAPLNVAFYSAMLTSLAVCMLINIAIKNPPGINYTIMLLLGVCFIWASDGGLAAQGLSGHNLDASISTIGLIAIAFGTHTAVDAFDPRVDMKTWRRFFYGCAIIALLLIPLMWWMSSPILTTIAVVLFLISLFSHALSTGTWKHHDERQQSMPLVASIVGLVLIGGIVALIVTGYGRGFLLSWDALKLVFAIVMLPILSAVIFALADVRLSRDHALEEAVEAARRDAATSASLLEMEKQYTKAREVASARSRQLSTASHDIRQPLASMRAELDALRDDAPANNLKRLDRVLDHLEAFTRSLSASGRAPIDAGLHGEVDVERVEISLLFDTLRRLFQAEAAQADIALSFETSAQAVAAPPLILIRMLSNLLSNAIQHSGASKIRVFCEIGDAVCFFKVSDNGTGFMGDEIDWAMAEGVKGDSSDGSGLGLSIVRQLSETYDLPLSANTSAETGTAFAISVPLAQ
ncbi:MAG: HAMP domain-containing sensor histidine kinase [Pseudomonadota bacterium]